MATWQTRRAFAALGLLTAALPALAQDRPQSILPPGFGDQSPPPPEPRLERGQPSPTVPVPAPPRDIVVTRPPLADPLATPAAPADEEDADAASPEPDAATLARYEIPPYARRSLDAVGVAGPAEGALGPDAFAGADGVFVEQLMRRIRAPIASRWLSIALRRALLARVETPARVNGADFAAERAWLLLRMGEADGARALVQAVDSDRYTPKLYQVAMQAALATGDPAALCPIADAASRALPEAGWTLARAMCAGLSGEPGIAGPLLDGARSRRLAGGIDLLLAEKVVGAGSKGRRAVTIQWDGVERLNAWRYGLATATGVAIPDRLLAGVGPRVQYWRATAAMIPPRQRAAAAELAAAQGVLSNLALVDLYGLIDEAEDQGDEGGVARDLRAAYAERQVDDRLAALRQLWGEQKTGAGHYARLVLTARAAARIPAADRSGGDTDRLVAAMLSAGLDLPALRWLPFTGRGSDARAMLLLAEPRGGVVATSAVGASSTVRTRMLFAGLAGLGRLTAADIASEGASLQVAIGAANAWTRAIDAAAARGQAGTVLVLAAAGMGTPDWAGVPPEALYHIVAALSQVGLRGEARMIAAEAVARA